MLTVRNINVACTSPGGSKKLVEDASFSIERGEVLVILGESGSGKTTLCRALTGLYPDRMGVRLEGSVMFFGEEILQADMKRLMILRRDRIRYVPQGGTHALNPVRRIRTQLRSACTVNTAGDPEFLSALEDVGISDGEQVLSSFPHQLSGGMAQRVLIAMAILGSPDLLIADEPTSAVDSSLKFRILDLLKSVQRQMGLGLIIVTHDMDVAKAYGDRIMLMYAGRVVEVAPRQAFFDSPLHPYARMLQEARLATVGEAAFNPELYRGDVPEEGCRFHHSCPICVDDCLTDEPVLETRPGGREVRCPYSK